MSTPPEGLRAWPAEDRLIEVAVRDGTTHDTVRDLTVRLGLGLVRLQERHHRIEDVFRDESADESRAESRDELRDEPRDELREEEVGDGRPR